MLQEKKKKKGHRSFNGSACNVAEKKQSKKEDNKKG